jgi:hypothetical protein
MSDKDKLVEMIEDLLNNRFKEDLMIDCKNLINSGGVDMDEFDERSYRMARIILYASVKRNTEGLVIGQMMKREALALSFK